MSIDHYWLQHQLGLETSSDKHRRMLESVIQVMNVPPGMPIAHQGREGKSLFLLRSGRVNVIRKSGEGSEKTISSHAELSIFGELSFFSREVASATVEADDYCIVYAIDRDHFHRLMVEAPDLAMSLMTLVVRNLGNVIRRLDSKLARL